jgi:hypothetical protein
MPPWTQEQDHLHRGPSAHPRGVVRAWPALSGERQLLTGVIALGDQPSASRRAHRAADRHAVGCRQRGLGNAPDPVILPFRGRVFGVFRR